MNWVPWVKVDKIGLARYVSAAAGKDLRLAVARHDLLKQENGRTLVCKAVYEALLGKDLRYSIEPYNADRRCQEIRSPTELLSGAGNGTCLDLACLFAGVCLDNDLLPVLVVVRGHAFVLVSLDYGRHFASDRRRLDEAGAWTSTGVLHGDRAADADVLAQLMQSQTWLPIECTGFAFTTSLPGELPEGCGRVDGRMSFAQACSAGRAQAKHFLHRPLEFAIDVALVHDSGIAPYDHESPWQLDYLWEVPGRDAGYVKRRALVDQVVHLLVDGLQADLHVRISPSPVTLCGSGGVGKTTAAIAVCCDHRVQEAFPDGIIWVTFGQDPSVLRLLNEKINTLGGGDDRTVGQRHVFATTVANGTRQLAALAARRRMLIVIDDVWQASHLLPFLVGSASCRVLVTCRDLDVAKAVKAKIVLTPVMTSEEARQLLEGKCEDLPGRPDQDQLDRLARAVGCLPLALELAGQRIEDGYPVEHLLSDLTSEIARLDVIDRSNFRQESDEAAARQLSLNASLNLSLARLPTPLLKAFAWLGIVRDEMPITAEFAATLWSTDISTARRDLLSLAAKSLLQRVNIPGGAAQQFMLHDVMLAKARNLLQGDPLQAQRDGIDCLGIASADAHRILLQNYRQNLDGAPWHAIARDSYIEYNLVHHLRLAKCQDELFDLLGVEFQSSTDEICTNAWYWFREQGGEVDYFVSDVVSALRWALEDIQNPANETRQPALIGYAVQFCAMLSSVNSLGKHINLETVVALVDSKIWSMQAALAHGRKHFRASELIKLAARAEFPVRCEIITNAIRHVEARANFGWKVKQFLGMLNDLDDEESGVVVERVRHLLSGERHRILNHTFLFFSDTQGSKNASVNSTAPKLSAVDVLDDMGCYLTAYVHVGMLASKRGASEFQSHLDELVDVILRFNFSPPTGTRIGVRQENWLAQYCRSYTRALYAGLTIKSEFSLQLAPPRLQQLNEWCAHQLEQQHFHASLDPVFSFRVLRQLPDLQLDGDLLEHIFCALDDPKFPETHSETDPDPLGRRLAQGLVDDVVNSLPAFTLHRMVEQAIGFSCRDTASVCLAALGRRVDEQTRVQFVDSILSLVDEVRAWKLLRDWGGSLPESFLARQMNALLRSVDFRKIKSTQLELIVEDICQLVPYAIRLTELPLLAVLRQCPVQLGKAALLRSVLPMLPENSIVELLPMADAMTHFESKLISYRAFIAALPAAQSLALIPLLAESAQNVPPGPRSIRMLVEAARGLSADASALLLTLALKAASDLNDSNELRQVLAVCMGGLAEPMRSILLRQRPLFIGLGDYQGVDRLVKSRFYEFPRGIGDISAAKNQLMAYRKQAGVSQQQPKHGMGVSTAIRGDPTSPQLMDLSDQALVAKLARELEQNDEGISRVELFQLISPWIEEFNWRGMEEAALGCTLGLRACAVWWP